MACISITMPSWLNFLMTLAFETKAFASIENVTTPNAKIPRLPTVKKALDDTLAPEDHV